MKSVLFASALAMAWLTPPANAAQDGFLSDLAGKWSGSGRAYLKGLGRIPASCSMQASGGETSVDLNGKCGILLFKIGLGLKLKDEGGNRFSGTYTGSRTGPAKLEGKLQGSTLVMDITWNGEVNGDTKAQMVLERTGPNVFSQTVTDMVRGDTIVTSKFTFTRS